MAFQLSTSEGRKAVCEGIASEEEIERQESFGYTHFVFNGVSNFIDMNDQTDMDRFKHYYSLDQYKWFHEATGDKNWVLYDPSQFVVDKNWEGNNVLKFQAGNYNGSPVTMPVNASSLCGMFSWMTIPKNIRFSQSFNLKGVKDTSLMFAGCIFPDGFQLPEKFNTKEVENMRYMFYKSKLPANFSLGDGFITEACVNMEYMFSRAYIMNDFSFGENFTTENTQTLYRMFYEATFNGEIDFGDKLRVYSKDINDEEMFKDIVINNNKYTMYPEYGRPIHLPRSAYR